MKPFKMLIVAATLATSLAGCSVFERLVYKIDIPQGNYIEQEQVSKLRVNMTPDQVVFILGQPMLRDSFGIDAWHYVYHFKAGDSGEIEQKQLSVRFTNGRVSSIEGDYALDSEFYTPLNLN